MLSVPEPQEPTHIDIGATRIWTRRLIILLTILAAIALAATIFWGLSHMITSVLVVVFAAFIAYAIAPAVKMLQKVIPRALAILLAYLLVLIILGFIFYAVIRTAVIQIQILGTSTASWLMPDSNGHITLLASLLKLGLTQSQIDSLQQQIGGSLSNIAGSVAGGIVPMLSGVAGGVVNILLTLVISIYFLVGEADATRWLHRETPRPLRGQVASTIEILQRVLGGYIRGQITLCAIVGVLVGVGLFLIGFPFAVLIGVLTFITEFIPVLGTIFTGIVAVLLALTQGGWIMAVEVLVFFVLVHILEGYILSPRLIGNAVKLNPALMLIALTVGSELFGVFGAVFAAPTAGLLQAFFTAIWIQYRQTHKEEFDEVDEQASPIEKSQEIPMNTTTASLSSIEDHS